MSNLLLRSLTGAVYVLLMTASVFWSSWLMLALFTFFAIAGTYELSLFYRTPSRSTLTISVLSGLFFLTSGVLMLMYPEVFADPWFFPDYGPLVAILLVLFCLVLNLLRIRYMVWLRAMIYLVLPLILMLSIRQGAFIPGMGPQPWALMGVFIIIWVNDTGAYLSGRFFGKHPMAPSISPKKTWEGLIGGILLAGVATVILARLSGSLNLRIWIGIFLLTVSFGTLGDLFESWLKRRAGLKDSGTILPGHGGVLDRLDSLLLAVPLVFAALILIFAP